MDQWAQRAGIALVVGPVVFVVVMVVEQTLRPGFSVLSNTISDLGVDTNGWSYAWMFSAFIIILGLLTLVAAYALIQVLGRSSRNGAILLSLAGVATSVWGSSIMPRISWSIRSLPLTSS